MNLSDSLATGNDKGNGMVGQKAESSLVTKYVRVTGVRNNKFVEFDFSYEDPSIFLELVLPLTQFDSFCKRHQVKELTPEQEAEVDFDKLKWRYGQPGVQK
ncbi:MAG: phenol hydroxylase subunit [Sedimenticola sp.]